MKILLLDIETAPNLVHVWGLWQQNVGINQILDSGYVMCYSAKWYGEEEIFFDSIYDSSPKTMLKGIHKMLDEADVVVHYNGSKFDIPTLNKEFILYNMLPPAPYKQVDLLKTARQQFKFPSNKLDYIAQSLGLGSKVHHRGHELWISCMSKDPDAWEEMKQYNIQDVFLLEALYSKMLPWIKNHPNRSLYSDETVGTGLRKCPKCGGTHLQSRGYLYTATRKYRRYRCKDCGGWSRGTETVGTIGKGVTGC